MVQYIVDLYVLCFPVVAISLPLNLTTHLREAWLFTSILLSQLDASL